MKEHFEKRLTQFANWAHVLSTQITIYKLFSALFEYRCYLDTYIYTAFCTRGICFRLICIILCLRCPLPGIMHWTIVRGVASAANITWISLPEHNIADSSCACPELLILYYAKASEIICGCHSRQKNWHQHSELKKNICFIILNIKQKSIDLPILCDCDYNINEKKILFSV